MDGQDRQDLSVNQKGGGSDGRLFPILSIHVSYLLLFKFHLRSPFKWIGF